MGRRASESIEAADLKSVLDQLSEVWSRLVLGGA